MHRLLPALTMLLLLCSSCPKGEQLPAQPQLAREDLGIGLSLLQTVDEAKAVSAPATVELKVLNADDKDSITGYDPAADADELVAIYYDADPGGDPDPLSGVISDIRCFLNTGSRSPVKLLGSPLASQGADEIEQLLGPALDRSEQGDGQIHLSYLFDPQIKGQRLQLRLITSHHLDKSCYAIRLVLEHKQ